MTSYSLVPSGAQLMSLLCETNMPSGSPRYKRDVELSFGSPVRGLPSLTTTNSNNPNWTTLMVFLNTKLITGISFIVVYLTAIATPVVQGLPATEARTDHLVCGLDVAPYCPSGYVCCGPYFEPINGGNGTAYGSCYPAHGICPD